MNKKNKILFMDLDGTLYNDQKEVTAGNRRALNEALAAGHKIAITTGRALSSALELAQNLQLTAEGCYIIAYNGGLIYDTFHGEVLFVRTLPLDLVHEFLQMAHRFGIHAHTYSGRAAVAEYDSEALHRYAQTTNMDWAVVDDVRKDLTESPCKMLVVDYEDHKHIEEFCDQFAAWVKEKLDYFFSCDSLLELVPKGVNKGLAVRMLAEKLEIPMENTVAAGDADNDIPMLQAAHIGALMCNAADYMRGIGDYITIHDNNHDGIAEIIDKFILEK
ncbi:MAG: Cof-type HAD-IIB family hydrolase [Eubacteriales bacterium]|nr:Cof-type HAD-IIB family hydrolase [Eubacteriales bacterium]